MDKGSSVLVDCKLGSEAADEGDSECRQQRTISRINHIDGRGSKEGSSSAEDQQQNQGHHRRRWLTSTTEEQQDQRHRRERIKEGSLSERISSRNNHVVGGTADRSSTSTQRIKRIFIVGGTADKAHPRRPRESRGSASSEERRRGLLHAQIPCGSISCYFDFTSLQSKVVPVWGWLSLAVFEYRSSVLMDCKFGSEAVGEGDSEGRLQRISIRINYIDGRGPKEGSSSARISSRINDIIVGGTEDDQPHRRKRIKEGSSSARISSRINDIIVEGTAGDQPHRQ